MSKLKAIVDKITEFKKTVEPEIDEAVFETMEPFFKKYPELHSIKYYSDYGSTDEGESWTELRTGVNFGKLYKNYNGGADRHYSSGWEDGSPNSDMYRSDYCDEAEELFSTVDFMHIYSGNDMIFENPYFDPNFKDEEADEYD